MELTNRFMLVVSSLISPLFSGKIRLFPEFESVKRYIEVTFSLMAKFQRTSTSLMVQDNAKNAPFSLYPSTRPMNKPTMCIKNLMRLAGHETNMLKTCYMFGVIVTQQISYNK